MDECDEWAAIINRHPSMNSSVSRKDRSRAHFLFRASSSKVDAARANRYCWIHYLRGVCVQSKQAVVVLSGVGERRQRECVVSVCLTVSSCPKTTACTLHPVG
jgi:hypothetical protein